MSVLTLILSVLAQSQTIYEDVVYLKNGSIIHGMIIEQVPNQSIKIQTKDGNVFFCKIEEVQKMTKELVENSKNFRLDLNKNTKKHGFTNITELSLALGIADSKEGVSFGIQTINGYQFNPNLNAGFGIGIDRYETYTTFPMFIDFRINFLSSSVSPFFEAAGGYSFFAPDGPYNFRGGLLLNPSIGVKLFVSSKTALNFSIGYKRQENTYRFSSGGVIFNSKLKESMINLKFGATF